MEFVKGRISLRLESASRIIRYSPASFGLGFTLPRADCVKYNRRGDKRSDVFARIVRFGIYGILFFPEDYLCKSKESIAPDGRLPTLTSFGRPPNLPERFSRREGLAPFPLKNPPCTRYVFLRGGFIIARGRAIAWDRGTWLYLHSRSILVCGSICLANRESPMESPPR